MSLRQQSIDFSKFFTGFLVLSGFALPVMLIHIGAVTLAAGLMSLGGGFLVYGTIVLYILSFSDYEAEEI